MPENAYSYEDIFGSSDQAAPETPPENRGTYSYDDIFGTAKPARTGLLGVQDPKAGAMHNINPSSKTPDDRNFMQKYWVGAVRQETAGLLDAATGIPFAGVTWLGAGFKQLANQLPPEQGQYLAQIAANINKGVGEGLERINQVAGRPVVEIPDNKFTELFGVNGQDAFRMVAAFAPIPWVAGETAAAKGGEIGVKAFVKAFGFQLAIAEAGPSYELAAAENDNEWDAALKNANKALVSSAALTSVFFGFGALKENIQRQRVQYAIGAAVNKDAAAAGSIIGDASARTEQQVKLAADKIVFHATPHDFDEFNLEKVGTGEGHQAFGHGLYVAENPGVVDQYERKFALHVTPEALKEYYKPGRVIKETPSSSDTIIKYENHIVTAMRELNGMKFVVEYGDLGADHNDVARVVGPNSRTMTVQIPKGTTEKMLDWDKRLDQQSPHVQEVLKKLGVGAENPEHVDMLRKLNGQLHELEKQLREAKTENDKGLGDGGFALNSEMADLGLRIHDLTIGENPTGKQIYSFLSAMEDERAGLSAADASGGDAKASKRLKEAGILGNKYYDGMSRDTKAGTRNFVLFDDKLAKIIKKGQAKDVPRGTESKFAQTPMAPGDVLKSGDPVLYQGEQWIYDPHPQNPDPVNTADIYKPNANDRYDGKKRLTVARSLITNQVPMYDPETPVIANLMHSGEVIAPHEMTNSALQKKMADFGYTPADVKQTGWVYGPEKRFYSDEEMGRLLNQKVTREAALVQAETLERANQIASDAAAQSKAPNPKGPTINPGTPSGLPNTNRPGRPRTAFDALSEHADKGGGSHDFDVNTLPNVRPEWKHFGIFQQLWENVVLKPFNPLLTAEQQSNLRWTLGEYNKVFHDGHDEAFAIRRLMEGIFPYQNAEQRANQDPNYPFKAILAAGVGETKFSKGDQVQSEDGRVWTVERMTNDDQFLIKAGKEERLVPQESLKGYGLLQRELALQGMTWDQKAAIEFTMRAYLDRIHARAVAAGALKSDQYIKDYFVRSFKPPPKWSRTQVNGFMDKFLTVDAAKNEHALNRFFRLHEEAWGEGFTPASNHIGTMLYNYGVSMAESTARSIARTSSVKQLKELGLASRVRPNEHWISVDKADAPEYEGLFIPKDAFAMLRPLLETRGSLPLLDKADKWNHIAKRFGLGLDFYNSMNIIRGTISTGQVPWLSKLRAYNDYFAKNRSELLSMAEQGGLNFGQPTDYVARDQAKARDLLLSGGEDVTAAIREGKYGEAGKRALLKAQGAFYWVEENAVQNLLSESKKAAFYKDFTKAEAYSIDKLGRPLTEIEQRRLIQKTALDVNQRFGGQNLEQMGRSKMMRVLLRMTMLSPDWTESRLRLYGSSVAEGARAGLAPIRASFGNWEGMKDLAPQNTSNLRSSIKLFATTAAATELLNMAMNGGSTTDKNDKGNEIYAQLPFTTKYGTHPAVNLWGYQEMPARLMQHFAELKPELFLNERQAPALNALMTVMFSQDNFGEKLTGDIPFMRRPPLSEREKAGRVAMQKAMIVTGQLIPSIFSDTLTAYDRSMRDGAIDGVRSFRALANFVAVKISADYPTEIRTDLDFLENNTVRMRAEVKRLQSSGQLREAQELKREWNERVDGLSRKIHFDPTLRTVFRRREDTITTFKIR